MKKIYLILTLLTIPVFISNAQIIKKYFDYPGYVEAKDILVCSDGGYFVLAQNRIIRTDKEFEIIWEKQIDFSANRATETSNGFYVGGKLNYRAYLTKFDKQGNFLWGKSFSNYRTITNILSMSDSVLIMSLVYYYYALYLEYSIIKTDTLGNIIWNYFSYTDATSELFKLDSNNISLIGNEFTDYPPEFQQHCTPKLDVLSIQGSHTLEHYYYQMDWAECTSSTFDGEFYYITTDNSDYSISRVNDSSICWTSYYANLSYKSICTDTLNLFLTGGNNNHLFVLTLTNEGDSISYYFDNDYYYSQGVRLAIDNDSLIILGNVKKVNGIDQSISLTKISKQDILTKNPLNKAKNKLITIYPNPAQNRIYFINTKSTTHKTIKIYNNSGQLQIFSKIVNNYVDISKLDDGLYFIEIIYNNKRYIQKFIKDN